MASSLARFIVWLKFLDKPSEQSSSDRQANRGLAHTCDRGRHFTESLDFATGGGVVELCYGITNHSADSLVACCLALEKGILFWSEPHFANDVSFVHCFLKIRYELRVSLPPVRQLWQVGFWDYETPSEGFVATKAQLAIPIRIDSPCGRGCQSLADGWPRWYKGTTFRWRGQIIGAEMPMKSGFWCNAVLTYCSIGVMRFCCVDVL